MPNITVKVGTSGKQIYLYGDMFNYKTDAGLYLSSNKFDGKQKSYNFYTGIRSTSAGNPPFSAYPIFDYVTHTNNVMSFTLPTFYTPQKLEIIFANDAGYQKASEAKRFDYIEIVE